MNSATALMEQTIPHSEPHILVVVTHQRTEKRTHAWMLDAQRIHDILILPNKPSFFHIFVENGVIQ